ncbi:MAG: hypothetical protein ACKOQ8_05600 [Micrococcales bacterium]
MGLITPDDNYYNFDPGFFDDEELDEDGNPIEDLVCRSCEYTNCQCDAGSDYDRGN